MKKLYTYELKAGMIAADSVLDLDKRLILESGTVLTENHIERLVALNVISIYVEETNNMAPDLSSLFDEEVSESPTVENKKSFYEMDDSLSYSEKVKNSKEFKEFKASYDINLDSFKEVLNNVVEKNVDLDVSTLLDQSLNMITQAQGGSVSVFDMLHNMREYDDSTFAHSMNVALISNVLASWLKLSPSDVEMATACGLFHDAGKLMVPRNLITKPGKLTNDEYTEVRKHTITGYHLLQKQGVDVHIQNAALMHHERYDGTGYPLGIKGEQMDRFARIVSIADVYDAMTAARCYRGALCPFTVIEIFEKEGLQKYDPEYILTFLENVVNTYLQNKCILSDGRVGTIIFVNKAKLSRPIVSCDGKYINLADYPDLKIEKLL